MSEEIRVVKSPLPYGIEKLPSSSSGGLMTVHILLRTGVMITNPEQFEDKEDTAIEIYSDDSTVIDVE